MQSVKKEERFGTEALFFWKKNVSLGHIRKPSAVCSSRMMPDPVDLQVILVLEMIYDDSSSCKPFFCHLICVYKLQLRDNAFFSSLSLM